MLTRIALLGALGYAGYRLIGRNTAPAHRAGAYPDNLVAGGPLSAEAELQHNPDGLSGAGPAIS